MKVKPAKKKPAFKEILSEKCVEDSYEPSNEVDRKKRLLSIRKKIKAGYYNSEEVVEDLSESFAQIFDQK